jgi:LPXTG-motif cell wall-anchored protein
MRRILAAAAVGAAAALAFAAPAQATDEPAGICPTWKVRSTIYPNPLQKAVEGSGILNATTAKLAKKDNIGTEIYTKDLGVDLGTTPTDITVEYELGADASYASGAVRLFYYDAADADTLLTAPTKFDHADANKGQLTISGVTGKIGTLGLVYDPSNSETALSSVTFSNLKIGDRPVYFRKGKCPSPSASPSSPETKSPTPAAPGKPSTTPTTPAAVAGVGGGQSAGSLPVTGASVPVLGGVAALLLVGGGAAVLLARRRRTRFTA